MGQIENLIEVLVGMVKSTRGQIAAIAIAANGDIRDVLGGTSQSHPEFAGLSEILGAEAIRMAGENVETLAKRGFYIDTVRGDKSVGIAPRYPHCTLPARMAARGFVKLVAPLEI